MFKRGIRICTGTGIGAALSTCIQSPNWFLIWIGSDQEKTFGPTITGLIHNNIEPERMILWDSKKRGGRPDTVKLLKEVWDSFGAEVIFITSNMKGNDEMMQGCRAGMFIFLVIYPYLVTSLTCETNSWVTRIRHSVGLLNHSGISDSASPSQRSSSCLFLDNTEVVIFFVRCFYLFLLLCFDSVIG